jgi:hypothetical protein
MKMEEQICIRKRKGRGKEERNGQEEKKKEKNRKERTGENERKKRGKE